MVMMPRKMGSTASLRYHAAKAKGRSGGGSIYADPTYQTVVFTFLAICSLPLFFFAGLLALGATLVYGPIVWLIFGVVALAITALIKGWRATCPTPVPMRLWLRRLWASCQFARTGFLDSGRPANTAS